MVQVRGVLETCLYAHDLEAAEAFYVGVLGLERYASVPGRHVFFRCGRAMFLVFNAEATKVESPIGVPAHGAVGEGHVAFEIEEPDLGRWKAKLEEKGVQIETDFEWPGGGRSLYFRDPSRNSVELTTRKTWGL